MGNSQVTPAELEQFQLLNEQAEQLNQYKELLSQQLSEIELSISSLNEINNIPENAGMLAPVADGIFINASLKDNSKVMVNVGANTVVEKSIPEAIKLLENEKKGLAERLNEAEGVLSQLNSQLSAIYSEAENNV